MGNGGTGRRGMALVVSLLFIVPVFFSVKSSQQLFEAGIGFFLFFSKFQQFTWQKIDKLILKFIWKFKGSKIYKKTLKKNKVGGLKLPDFKTYYNTIVIKTA